jgi:hypothetical protein
VSGGRVRGQWSRARISSIGMKFRVTHRHTNHSQCPENDSSIDFASWLIRIV